MHRQNHHYAIPKLTLSDHNNAITIPTNHFAPLLIILLAKIIKRNKTQDTRLNRAVLFAACDSGTEPYVIFMALAQTGSWNCLSVEKKHQYHRIHVNGFKGV